MSQCAFCHKCQKQWKNLSFHRFPNDGKLALWIKNMGLQNWLPRNYSVLCSDHFTSDCFDKRDFRTRLRKGSVPSLFDESCRPNRRNKLRELLIEDKSSGSNSKQEDIGAFCSATQVEECSIPACKSHNVTHSSKETSSSHEKENETSTCTPRTHDQQQTIIHDHHYSVSPQSFKRKLQRAEKLLQVSRMNNRVLKQRVKRLKNTVKSLRSTIQNLKK